MTDVVANQEPLDATVLACLQLLSYIRTDGRSPQGKDCSAKTQANSVMIKTEISAHASSSLHVSDTEHVGRLSASAKGDVYARLT